MSRSCRSERFGQRSRGLRTALRSRRRSPLRGAFADLRGQPAQGGLVNTVPAHQQTHGRLGEQLVERGLTEALHVEIAADRASVHRLKPFTPPWAAVWA